MQYRKFGKLDWQASALGFGFMRLPTIDDNPAHIDQEKTTEMLRYAVDAGLNYVDTAYVYHQQTSETALGIALQDGYRDKVHIATKLPIWMVNDSGDFDRMLDEELKRLQTDHIDFYLMHSLNQGTWEKLQKLNLLKKAEDAIKDGRIRYVGFSFHDKLKVFKEIVDAYDKWTFCQIQYNYMDIKEQAGTAGLRYAADKGLAVVIMEPLRGGRLAADLSAAKPIWAQAEHKRTPADWAFQWLWSQPEVSVVLSGMGTLEQVKQNLVSADESKIGLLNQEELDMISEVRETLAGLSPIGCTSCEYCLPCPNGVKIPYLFHLYNRIAMLDDLDGVRFTYKTFVAEGEKAKNCIQCGECLSKCPQQIPISDWMPVIEDVIGNGQPFQKSI
jgi:predicted aldo/keto reductase-like oxidoreductase